MDQFSQEVLTRLPLAEAAQRLLAFLLDEVTLTALYEKHRDIHHTKVITFPVLTRLIGDALFQNKSGRAVFEAARADDTLGASVEAAYGKLRRMPVAVSMALVQTSCQRLHALLPHRHGERTMPPSVKDFYGVILDGKICKGVKKRLKALRGAGGGLIGGRALVAYGFNEGLVLGCHGDEDGDANDVQYVPQVAAQVRAFAPLPCLWIVDAQFSFAAFLAELSQDHEAFVARLSGAAPFQLDPSKPARQGVDDERRPYREEWGAIGGRRGKDPVAVRRITVDRGPKQPPFVIVTSLLDATRYPAGELLQLYRYRPDIELVFQRITDVFSLRQLIGTTPRATLFQLALCFVLYNVLQVMRGQVAAQQERTMDEVSPRKFLEDVRDELKAGYKLLGWRGWVATVGEPLSQEELREWLQEHLQVWKPRWAKARRRRHRPPKPKRRSGHACAYRILHKVDTKTRK